MQGQALPTCTARASAARQGSLMPASCIHAPGDVAWLSGSTNTLQSSHREARVCEKVSSPSQAMCTNACKCMACVTATQPVSVRCRAAKEPVKRCRCTMHHASCGGRHGHLPMLLPCCCPARVHWCLTGTPPTLIGWPSTEYVTACGLPMLTQVILYVLPSTVRSWATTVEPSVGARVVGTLGPSRMGSPMSTHTWPLGRSSGWMRPACVQWCSYVAAAACFSTPECMESSGQSVRHLTLPGLRHPS
jgi:hypothetical protein